MKLMDFPTGKTAIVRSLQGPEKIIERLAEMGFHCGVQICLRGRAPWGGPLIVQVGKSYIAVRMEEAECLLLDPTA